MNPYSILFFSLFICNVYSVDAESITIDSIDGFSPYPLTVKHVKIENVIEIPESAFYQWIHLATVKVGDSVQTIGNYSFSYCRNISTITLGTGVRTIGNYAFFGCSFLQNIALPDALFEICDYSFAFCSSLPQISIPNNVETIGSYAFHDCYFLQSVQIGDSVKSIGVSAFYCCNSLSSIVIPKLVEVINDYCFYYCSFMESIQFLGNIKTIGSYAFYSCNSLPSITVSNVETIRNNAFDNCGFLQNITLGNALVTIGNFAFNECNSLSEILLPDTTQSIGFSAFYGCGFLQTISLGNNLITISDVAFAYCSSLEKITIPSSIRTIGYNPFLSCQSLISISLNNNAYYRIYDEKNYRFLCNYNLTTIISYPAGLRHTEIDFSSPFTTIHHFAFAECHYLTHITFSDSFQTISDSVFYRCYSLSNVQLGNSTKAIGAQAFGLCTSLKNIELPESLETFEHYPFLASHVNIISHSKKFSVINENGVEYLCDCDQSKIIYSNPNEGIVNISLPNISNIGDFSFYRCLQSQVIIGKEISTISNYAFDSCPNLEFVLIPDSVTQIGVNPFSNCSNLKSINASGTFAVYESSSVSFLYEKNQMRIISCIQCSKTTYIPLSILTIGIVAFSYQDSIESLVLPDSVETIESNGFYGCSSLKQISFGKNIKYIYDAAFSNCPNLQKQLVRGSTGPTISITAFDGYVKCSVYTPPEFDGHMFGPYKADKMLRPKPTNIIRKAPIYKRMFFV